MATPTRSNGHDPSASTSAPKWTIMIYLAGDGNLTAHCITVLQQLEAVAYRDDVHLVACFDSNTPAAKGSRYLEISRRRQYVNTGFDWELHNDLVSPDDRGHSIKAPTVCGPTTNGSKGEEFSRAEAAEGVRRFVNWAVENHEAERYMLIFMGHGPIVASQTFLAKENPQSFLRLADMRKVLAKHFGPRTNRKLSILACNNCVMNGIETAVEVKDEAEFMIGSQGLMLAAGWPYQKMIAALVADPDAPTDVIARKMLKACARNLLDFTLMERSSEQALCDLRKLGEPENIVTAVKALSKSLRQGLVFKEDPQGNIVLRHPSISDAVKLARLEAQSYWGETFVDLYDFCDRLLQKCNDLARVNTNFIKELGLEKNCSAERFRNTELITHLKEIIRNCLRVQDEVKQMVPESFYIGPELQYSHGLSIYFPWTRPEKPYFFTKATKDREFSLKTAFETYRGYEFARTSGWTSFLESFFRATLRRVRRADRTFNILDDGDSLDLGLVGQNITAATEMLAINLQKSSSDTGKEDNEIWPTVKNYPRRNYLSPADCPRKIDTAQTLRSGVDQEYADPQNPPVSYLGWNITGLVAEVIAPRAKPRGGRGNKSKTQLQRTQQKTNRDEVNRSLLLTKTPEGRNRHT